MISASIAMIVVSSYAMHHVKLNVQEKREKKINWNYVKMTKNMQICAIKLSTS